MSGFFTPKTKPNQTLHTYDSPNALSARVTLASTTTVKLRTRHFITNQRDSADNINVGTLTFLRVSSIYTETIMFELYWYKKYF